MPDIVTKDPGSNYASRSEGVQANIRYPTENGPPIAHANARATANLADQQLDQQTTAIDATTLRADVDAAMVAQGATACNNAGARTAIAAVITDALALSRTTQTTGPLVAIDT